MAEETTVKILFRFYSDILEEETSETMRAEVVDAKKGYYSLNSIPFYVPSSALGDIVWAEFIQDENMLAFRKTILHSGNSTIHVILLDDEYGIDQVVKILQGMGTQTNQQNYRYFGLSVPADLDYLPIKKKLDELESKKVLDYAESCLSEKHQYKNHFL